MSTLNDIPDELRDDRYADHDWSPEQGLVRGGVWATIVTGAMCGTIVVAGAFCPKLLGPWVSGVLLAVLGTCAIFGATHRAAGMSGQWTAIIATCCTAVMGLTYVVVRLLAVATGDGPTWDWTPMTGENIFLAHLWFWATAGGTAFLCKDGDGVVAEILDLMNTNVLTGRRMR